MSSLVLPRRFGRLRQAALWLLVLAQAGIMASAQEDYEQVRQRLLRQLNSLTNAAPVSVTAPAPAPAPVADPAPAAQPAAPLTLAAAAPVVPPAEVPEAMKLLDDKRVLSAGDRVSFRVLEDREDPKQLLVTDSGELEVPYVGRVKAAEKTCLALARELKVLLEKDYYHQATVVLAVDALAKSRGKVYLYGQVRSAGAFEIPVDETLTVSKVILRAGGFGDFANKKKVTVTRKVPGGRSENFELDLVDILEKGRSENDREVQDGDMIFVPQRLINF